MTSRCEAMRSQRERSHLIGRSADSHVRRFRTEGFLPTKLSALRALIHGEGYTPCDGGRDFAPMVVRNSMYARCCLNRVPTTG